MFELNVPRGFIVWCQAYPGEPMFEADIMTAYGRAAQVSGRCTAIRKSVLHPPRTHSAAKPCGLF
jgi:putative N-acetylmannosamine-6-phosphate epimerase